MRLGLISDVHGNLHALDAALAFLAGRDVDAYLCAGDLVGYGPLPNACVERLRELPGRCVAGNHDLIALGRLSDDRCAAIARDSLRWTRGALDDRSRAYLAELPLTASLAGVRVAHGSLTDPQEYVQTEDQALACLRELAAEDPEAAVLVVGHTHRAVAIGERRGTLLGDHAGEVRLVAGERMLVNPGAVGQSRSRDVRARVAVLDIDAGVATFHQLPYDVAGCRRALRAQGLPAHSHHLPRSRWRSVARRSWAAMVPAPPAPVALSEGASVGEPPQTGVPAVPTGAVSVVRASLLNLAARVAGGVAALGLAVLTANVLSTHDRGIYAILTTWAAIGAVLFGGGTPALAADLIHGRQREPALHAASAAIAILAALVVLPVTLGVAVLADSAVTTALLCTVAVVAFTTYSSFEVAIAQARGDVMRVSLSEIGGSFFALAFAVVAAITLSPTATTFVAAYAAGGLALVAVQLAWAISAGSERLIRGFGAARSIIRRSVSVAVANGTSLLTQRIDVLVVAAVLSASAAGVYSIPVALASNLLLLSRSLLTAMYQSIMTAPPHEVAARLSAALRHSVIVVLVGGALSVPVVALAGGAVFGSAYAGVWVPYAVLVPGAACVCIMELLRHFLLTRLERRREFVLMANGLLFLNGVLAVAGAAAFGLVGAAASTTLSYIVVALGMAAFCARSLTVSVRDLLLPRRADLSSYWRFSRTALAAARRR